jgi:AcrR family transcriptional regulator
MTETSNPSRADTTRARLLAAAVKAFADKGFHGTTTRDIAAAAGMSPAALYVHHRSKEELLYLIARTGHEHTLVLLREGIASSDDPVEQMRRVVHDFAVSHARDHTRARIINYELVALNPEHLAEIRAVRQVIDAEIRGLVERGVAAGAFDVFDPAMSATALLSLGIDIARWYREEGDWTPEHIGDRYAEMALRMLGAESAPPA